MAETAPIVEMVGALGRGLVDVPDEVVVTATHSGDRTMIELAVPDAQRGQVIGRGGRVAHALRTVTQAAGRARGERVGLDIVD